MNISQLIGRMLGLENVTAIRQIKPSLAAPWAHGAAGWVFFGCVVLSAWALFVYVKRQPRGSRAARICLAGARAAALSLLLVFLADPVINVVVSSKPRPVAWVLFDGTDSMDIRDELSSSEAARLNDAVGLARKPEQAIAPAANPAGASPGYSRADYVRAWLRKSDNNVLARLQEKFRLKAFVFDRPDEARGLEAGAEKQGGIDLAKVADGLSTRGQVTAIGATFEDLAARHATGNLAGLIVISDFDQNSGAPPLAKAKSLSVPIYTVGVGPTSALDLAIDLQSPPLMKKAERATISVVVRQTGLEGQSIPVTVTARRLGGAGDDVPLAETLPIGERQVELRGSAQSLEFAFTPEETGRFELIAQSPPAPGEVVDQNNRATREVNIRDDFLRLMFVEHEPTWEWRFVKEVFYRDKLVGPRGFRTFLRSADPKVRAGGGLFLPTLAPPRSEFFANDVLFIGDMPAGSLSPRFCEMVKEFVGAFGGGLVLIGGPRFGPGQLAATPLADMLPVVVDGGGRLQDRREFVLQLTPAAQQFDFMQLGKDEAENRKAWLNLGPLPWYQPVSRPHPLATVLAEHPRDTCVDGKTPQPIIAIRRYGRGEVVYLGFDETWRLRRKYGELYYRQFWGQMIHRLGLSHALGSQKRFVVRTDRPRYQVDDKATITVEAYDANFEPLSEDKIPNRKLVAQWTPPDRSPSGGEPQELPIAQSRAGVFEARLSLANAGEHRVRVEDPVTGDVSEVSFQVASLSAERRGATRNLSLQEEIAQSTGGRSYDLGTAGQLIDDIQANVKEETATKVVSIWDTWLGFGLVTTLLLGEWLFRKRINLP